MSTLLQGIQVNHNRVQAAVVVVMSREDLKADFVAASAYLSEQIAVTFSGAGSKSYKQRIGAVDTRSHGKNPERGRGARKNSHRNNIAGRGRGNQQGNTLPPNPVPRQVYGIDISDVNRFFQEDEFQKLPQ